MTELYSDASQILGYDLLKLSLEGPKSVLDETKYCQVIVKLIKSVKILLSRAFSTDCALISRCFE